MEYLQYSDVNAYKTAFVLANVVWNIASKWQSFARNTVGEQFVRAADSISANLAEGYGRYHKKDKIKFYYYALGSLMETRDWIQKATVRDLVSEDQKNVINPLILRLPKEIRILIKITNEKLTI